MGKIVSLEFKNRRIIILEGSRRGQNITVHKSVMLNVDLGSIDDGKIVDMESIIEKLEKAFSENNIRTKNATFIINTNTTITRSMDLPVLKSNAETMSMIKNELDQLLSVNLDNYKLIYKSLGKTTESGIEKAKYMVHGLPVDIYDDYVQLAERLKLELNAIDLSQNCLDKIRDQKLTLNSSYLKSGESAAFVDIGYSSISFSVLSGGKNVFTRISSSGMNDVVKNYSAVFSMSDDDSMREISKLSLWGYDENIMSVSKVSVLENNVNMWLDEFNRYIRYYNSNNKDNQIKKIYIYGMYSKIQGIEEYMEEHLNLSTELINNLSNIDSGVDVTSYLNSILSVFIGKKDINFLYDKKKQHKSSFSTGVVAMAVGLIIILTAAYFGYSYMVEKSHLEKEIEAMNKFISNEENIALNSESIETRNKATLLQRYMDEVTKLQKAISSEDAINSLMFEQLAAAIPLGTKINSMSADGTAIQLQCTSATRQETAQFEKNLKEIEFIDKVYIPAVVDETEGGSSNYSYTIVCDLKDVISYEAE